MYNQGVETPTAPGLSGRQAQAARNDLLIMAAAREVFTEDHRAPIAAVAERAGVGISALYRRFASKEALLQHLMRDGQRRYTIEVERALADERDPWEAFATFMRRVLDEDTHALTLHLAGKFTPSDELWREGDRAGALTMALIARTKDAGALRQDFDVGDITMLFEQLAAITVGDRERTRELRHRYLELFLQALRAPGLGPLPAPAPSWDEISQRFAPAT